MIICQRPDGFGISALFLGQHDDAKRNRLEHALSTNQRGDLFSTVQQTNQVNDGRRRTLVRTK